MMLGKLILRKRNFNNCRISTIVERVCRFFDPFSKGIAASAGLASTSSKQVFQDKAFLLASISKRYAQ